ncbi:hypothetical protein K0M31_011739 [Melipona bicolor]|uniref:Uncharacterized protein n=1 Tax=Melipona bicolor TaxID=60889 RepID=A0AA40GA46_9HYME|nr:hypothetical protein K0M31_011739 [Melipona bicolor]
MDEFEVAGNPYGIDFPVLLRETATGGRNFPQKSRAIPTETNTVNQIRAARRVPAKKNLPQKSRKIQWKPIK